MFKNIHEINLLDLLKESIENQSITHSGNLKVIKKSKNSGTLRTPEVWGHFGLPIVGQAFVLITEALDKSIPKEDSLRFIKTSEILEIYLLDDSKINFQTLNSIYEIDEIKRIENVYSC